MFRDKKHLAQKKATAKWRRKNPGYVRQWQKKNKLRVLEIGRKCDNTDARKEAKRKWRKRNKIKCRELSKRWRKNNPQKYHLQQKKDSIKKKYGILLEEYNLRLAAQNYKCMICNKVIRGKTAHLDHDHKTKKLRDFLCSNCNTALGLLKENVEILKKAIQYLRRHKC